MASFVRCQHGRTSPQMCIRCKPDSTQRRRAEAVLPFIPLNDREAGVTQATLTELASLRDGAVSRDAIPWLLENALDVEAYLREHRGAGPGAVLCEDGTRYFFSTDEDEIRQFAYTRQLHRAYTTVIRILRRLDPYLRRISHNSPAGRVTANIIKRHLREIIDVIQEDQGSSEYEDD